MSGYVENSPVRPVGVDADGTFTAEISDIGDDMDFCDFENRMPAFLGLAKRGGFYAENQKGMTLTRAMEAAKMNFEVRFQDNIEVTTMNKSGTTTVTYPHRGTFGIWPDGRTVGFGMVKSRYQIVQPDEAGALGQMFMDESDANVVAAGTYGDPLGAKSYLAFKLPEGFDIGGEDKDKHDLYLTILNSYDGSTSTTGLLAPIRIECTNMNTITFGSVKNRFRIQHSGNIEDKLQAAREALGLASKWTGLWKKAAEKLLDTPMRGRQIDRFLLKALPTPEKITTERGAKNWADKRFEIKTIITQSETCAFGRDTAYSALQGVHEWADWHMPADNAMGRFVRILDGTGEAERLKIHAANLLLSR